MKKPKKRKGKRSPIKEALEEMRSHLDNAPVTWEAPLNIFDGYPDTEEGKFTRLKANLHLAWAEVHEAIHGLQAMGYQTIIRERSSSNPHPDQDGHYQTKFWYDLDVVKVVHQEKPL